MKNILIVSFLISSLFVLNNCENSKKLQNISENKEIEKKVDVLRYDTASDFISIYLKPKNYDDHFYYTNEIMSNPKNDFDTTIYTFFENKSIYKNLYVNHLTNIITQVNFRDSNIVAKGEYILNDTINFSHTPLFDNNGNDTDTLIVEKYLKGFRNGNWLFWDKNGNLTKKETWKKGVKIN